MSRKKEMITHFLGVTTGLFILTSIFWFTKLDIYLERFFYQENIGWFLKSHGFWIWLYEYGTYPGLLVFLISLLILVAGLFTIKLRKYRKVMAFLVLFMFIGSGLIVNFIFKDHWGRPRPREIIEFGGAHQYVSAWMMGATGKNSSFPSGHASVAFYMIFPYFFLLKQNKKYAYFFLAAGLVFGLLMGAGRMIQGGHFASDVLWAGGFMYLTGLCLYYALKLDKNIYQESKVHYDG